MGWYERLEEQRVRERLTMRALADRLHLSSPQTLYNWRQGHNRPSQAAVEAVARFLGESPADLRIEMGSATGTGQDELMAGLTARRLNAQWQRMRMEDMRRILDQPTDAGMVDIIVARLGQQLPDCVVSRLLSHRGRTLRVPYEHIVHVEPDPTDPDRQSVDTEQLRLRVQQALKGLRGPTWWERSPALLPRGWNPDGVTLIYPRLLEDRSPEWLNLRYEASEGMADIFVLSVYHGGAPDVGALLASNLGYGFSTITSLAAQLGSWTMNPLRTGREIAAQTDLARAITSPHSPIAGPYVWSVNDPEPILDDVVVQNLTSHFTGWLVFLELTNDALDYAAWQVAIVDGGSELPRPERVARFREMLSQQQAGLAAIAARLYAGRWSNRVSRLQIRLPREIRPGPDGGYPDSEDLFFDHWAESALKVRIWLDRFARDGQTEPGPGRVRQLVRADDLLGPLVHGRRRQPPSSHHSAHRNGGAER